MTLSSEDIAAAVDRLAEAIRANTADAPIALIGIRRRGDEVAQRVKQMSLDLYRHGRAYAASRGIIIADTKFEFGMAGDDLLLIDECLTPDSSRFWPEESCAPGGSPPSYDKQFVRDYLETLDWDKTDPAPALPAEVVEKTSSKYIEAYEKLTGRIMRGC